MNSTNLDLHIKCLGCPRIKWDQICSTYLEPKKQWKAYRDNPFVFYKKCPFHPETVKRVLEAFQKSPGFVDPLKASKQRARGKK